jgi:O-antigen ligase
MASVGLNATMPADADARRTFAIDVHLSKAFLLAFFLIFFYVPTAQVAQSRVIGTSFLAVMLLLFAAPKLNRTAIVIVSISIAACAEILLSSVVNFGPRQALAHAIFTSLKPLYLALMFVFGYACIASSPLRVDGIELRRFFTAVASAFILSQLLIAILQAAGAAGFLHNLYSQEKARDFTTIMRATGTLGNPNSLAFFTLQCFLFVLLLGTAGWFWRGMMLLLGAALIALTGSRSVLIVLMLCVAIFVLFRRKSLSTWVTYTLIAVPLFIALALFVQAYAEYFRYLSQLQLLMTTDSPLTKVNSMAARLHHWEVSLALFNSHEGTIKYLFGLGDLSEYAVLDNDYLYVALRNGAFGLVLFYGVYAALAARYFERSIDDATRFFGLLTFFAAAIVSLAGEFFSNWHHMVYFIVLTGALTAARSPLDCFGRLR